jgi:hypothetical protein
MPAHDGGARYTEGRRPGDFKLAGNQEDQQFQEDRRLPLHHLEDRLPTAFPERPVHLPYGVRI